jgi:hypothetical protein
VESGADLFDVGSVGADGFVELLAGDAELMSPIGDVGGHLGVDLFGIVGSLDVRTFVTVVVGVDDVVIDGLGGGEDRVFGVCDVLDRTVAVVIDVGHVFLVSFYL